MKNLVAKYQSVQWLLAELVVIVLGISLAFQVEEWRTELDDRRAETAMLESIVNDFEVAREQFDIFLRRVNAQANATRNLRRHFRSNEPISEEQVTEFVQPILGAYLWQATDSTWVSSNPSVVSNQELRRELIRFHDGFMPFMLNLSNRHQAAQAEFLDVLYDDFEISLDSDNLRLTAINAFADIPSNREFFEKMNNFAIETGGLRTRIPQALEAIDQLEIAIQEHLSAL